MSSPTRVSAAPRNSPFACPSLIVCQGWFGVGLDWLLDSVEDHGEGGLFGGILGNL